MAEVLILLLKAVALQIERRQNEFDSRCCNGKLNISESSQETERKVGSELGKEEFCNC